MKLEKLQTNSGTSALLVTSDSVVINDIQSILDLIATAQFEYDASMIIVYKESIHDAFFDLKTKLAGDILQKLVTYHCMLVIIGDFSEYTSKSFKDFVYESNKGTTAHFVPTLEQALET